MKQLQCGFSQIDITPTHPNEVFLDGYGHRVLPAEGVRDPIYAKVCVMQGEQAEFALVVLDICGLNQKLKDHLCDFIGMFANIKRENLALCTTHTHAAPACGVLANLPINLLYWNRVAKLVANAIDSARANTKAGSFRLSMGSGFDAPMNRRGKEVINRNVWVCGFYDRQDTLQGVIAAASCHAVCNIEYTISADFPGVLTARAAKAYPNVPFLYLQSRGADIDPPIKGEEGIALLGNQLSDLVLQKVSQLQEKESVQGDLRSAFKTVTVPMHYPDSAQLEQDVQPFYQQLCADLSVDARRYPEVELQWHTMAQKSVQSGKAPALPVDLQVVAIGNQLVFAFVPFEMLTVTGNTLENSLRNLGFPTEGCFVIGYANGTNGYLCPAAEWGQEGYETRMSAHWYMLPECSRDTEPMVLTEIAELAKSLL